MTAMSGLHPKRRKLVGMEKKYKAAVPHLVPDGNLHRCSVCGYPFQKDERPSLNAAFARHLLKAHRRGQMTEDSSQAVIGGSR